MNNKPLILSSSGLKNISSGAEYEKEFEFIFGQQRISIKNVFAEFISPTIAKLHQLDPTINNICFNDKFKGLNLSKSSISKFASLSKGEKIEICEEESLEMKIISILVDNEELFNKLNDLYSTEINETNIDHFLNNLAFFSQISQSFNYFNYNSIIDVISSHFYLIDKQKLKQVPNPILYSIICNSNLRLESEDSLLDFLNDLFTNEESYESIYFYEEIEYSMLSESKFNEFIDDFDSSKITQNLWMKLKRCFNKSQFINKVNENRYQQKSMTKREEVSYGIIDYLTKEIGGNVQEKGVVIVTSSSTNRIYSEKNAVDIHNNYNYFCSLDSPNSWLKYDFINRKVHPTAYSITTRHDIDYNQPRNWVIEGSNNNNNWAILDTRKNEKSLSGVSVTRTFDIKSIDESYRYLRIRQNGKNSDNFNTLVFSSLEFIGTLSDVE